MAVIAQDNVWSTVNMPDNGTADNQANKAIPIQALANQTQYLRINCPPKLYSAVFGTFPFSSPTEEKTNSSGSTADIASTSVLLTVPNVPANSMVDVRVGFMAYTNEDPSTIVNYTVIEFSESGGVYSSNNRLSQRIVARNTLSMNTDMIEARYQKSSTGDLSMRLSYHLPNNCTISVYKAYIYATVYYPIV